MLSEFTSNIENNKNFHFVKFGDGEFLCMKNISGYNCDFHPYSNELGEKLINSLKFLSGLENCFIAEWAGVYKEVRDNILSRSGLNPKFANYDLLLQQNGGLSQQLYDFYKSIKLSTRKKIFIGNKRLKEVNSFLNIFRQIEVPIINAFSKFESILTDCKYEMQDDAIYIFCSGMPAKPIISELIQYNPNITCLDVGSGFDPIFFNVTRHNQPPKNIVREFYKELLT